MFHSQISVSTDRRRRGLVAWGILFGLIGASFYGYALIHLADVFAAIAGAR